MKIVTNMLVVTAALLAGGVSSALAQDSTSQHSYQVSELQVSKVPVPSERPAAKLAVIGDHEHRPDADTVRRTASGIRIVGPTFFPSN